MARLSRTIALAMVEGPAAGLAALDDIPVDPRNSIHYRFDAARAHLLERAGAHADAIRYYRVPAALRGRRPSGRRSRVLPPLSGRLAGDRNHGVDEHQHAHANPRADQGCCETGERLHNEDHVARSDGIDDTVGIRREAGVFVVTRQIDRDREYQATPPAPGTRTNAAMAVSSTTVL